MRTAGRAWRSTTLRGRGLLGAGLLATVVGLSLDERQIVRLGVFLLLLTAVAAVLLVRTRRRLRTTASLSARRVEAGRPVTVEVVVEADGRLAPGPVGVRVGAPDGIRGGGGLVVVSPRAGQPAAAEVRLHPVVRGRHLIPPVHVEVRDALGLCRLERPVTEALPLTVLPHTETLRGALPATGTVTRGGGGSRSTGIAGDADTTVREYRSGDDRRRVHWRSSARLGELMVRGEEQQRQAAVTVLLDTRAGAHRLGGAAGTFEWAVVAAASLTRHLLLAGHEVRLLGPPRPDRTGRTDAPGGRNTAARTMVEMERLVDVRCTGERRNRMQPVAGVLPPPDPSVLVAVLGAVIDADLPALLAARTGRADALALLLDVDSWELGAARDRREARHHLDRSAAALRRAGWRTAVVERGTTVAAAWLALQGPGGRRPGAGTSSGYAAGTGFGTASGHGSADGSAGGSADPRWERGRSGATRAPVGSGLGDAAPDRGPRVAGRVEGGTR